MSGSFLDLDVPPTVISFAIAPILAGEIITPEFKEAGRPVYVFAPESDRAESQRAAWESFHALARAGRVQAAWAATGTTRSPWTWTSGNSKSCTRRPAPPRAGSRFFCTSRQTNFTRESF